VDEADRIREQYAEAERLVREAQRAAEDAAADEVPPRGWEVPGGRRPITDSFPDLSALAALLESLRGAIPPELARQLADALRELLLAVRAVLDWYIARLEPSERPQADVQDIPVE
jgi:hypothetical protein